MTYRSKEDRYELVRELVGSRILTKETLTLLYDFKKEPTQEDTDQIIQMLKENKDFDEWINVDADAWDGVEHFFEEFNEFYTYNRDNVNALLLEEYESDSSESEDEIAEIDIMIAEKTRMRTKLKHDIRKLRAKRRKLSNNEEEDELILLL